MFRKKPDNKGKQKVLLFHYVQMYNFCDVFLKLQMSAVYQRKCNLIIKLKPIDKLELK